MHHRKRDNYQKLYEISSTINIGDEEISLPSFETGRSNKSACVGIGGMFNLLMTMMALTIGFFMGYDQAYYHFKSSIDQISDLKQGLVHFSPSASALELMGKVQKTKATLLEKLWNEYGEFSSLLIDKNNLDLLFQISSASKERYRRRIIKKILQKQLNPKDSITFTWVTAGDVRAAGFGNQEGQSYTSMLDDTAREAFASVGVTLVAKNYGMYNSPSGPALAICINDVFGSDIDILNWDFALTDRDFKYRAALFGMRASLHPTRPMLMMVDRADDDRWKKFFWGEGKVGVALLDTQAMESLVRKHVPDSSSTDFQIGLLPPAIKYLQCNGAIEGHVHCNSGETYHICNEDQGSTCRENKFTIKDRCDMVKYQSDWNTGWKVHRLKGRLFGLFLIQILQEALLELDAAAKEISRTEFRREDLVLKYEQLEGQDDFLLKKSSIPATILGRYGDKVADVLLPLFKRSATCLFSEEVKPEEKGLDRRKLRVHRHLQVENIEVSNGTITSAFYQTNMTPMEGVVINDPIDVQVNISDVNLNPFDATQVLSDEASAVFEGTSFARDMNISASVSIELSNMPPNNSSFSASDGENPKVEEINVFQENSLTVESLKDEKSISNVNEDGSENLAGNNVGSEPQAIILETPTEKIIHEPEGNAMNYSKFYIVNISLSKDENEILGVDSPIKEIDVNDFSSENIAEPMITQPSSNTELFGSGTTVTVVNADETSDNTKTLEFIDIENLEKKSDSLIPPGIIHTPGADEKTQGELIDLGLQPSRNNTFDSMDLSVDLYHGPNSTEGMNNGAEVMTSDSMSGMLGNIQFTDDGKNYSSDSSVDVASISTSSTKASGSLPGSSKNSCEKMSFFQRDFMATVDEDNDFVAEIACNNDDAYLMVCFRTCTTGNCIRPLEGLDSVKLAIGNVEIEVDGVPVTSSREIDGCHFLEGETNGLIWKTRRETFRIRIRMKEEGGSLILYSVIAL